jgi:hypothetical protein
MNIQRVLFSILCPTCMWAQYVINTIAGNGTAGFAGD